MLKRTKSVQGFFFFVYRDTRKTTSYIVKGSDSYAIKNAYGKILILDEIQKRLEKLCRFTQGKSIVLCHLFYSLYCITYNAPVNKFYRYYR